jgi:NAD(P)-dependent dehydrogenase (short-subunit alcohol dehydrogenase family)
MSEIKTALITGASAGIGRAVALELARAGYGIAVVAVDNPQLHEATAEIANIGPARAFAADLSRTDAIPALVDEIAATFGRLDVLVNCAGISKRGALDELEDGDWKEGFSVKFFGTVAMIHAAWPHLKATSGSVVTIAGALGHTPSDTSLVGGTICSALINYTKGIAETGRRDGIRVNALNPGWIDTGRLGSQLQQKAQRDGHDDIARAGRDMIDELKILRFGQPQDVARLIAFLVSDAGSFIHGTAIDIDGGLNKGV